MKTLAFVLRLYVVVIYDDKLALPPKNNSIRHSFTINGSEVPMVYETRTTYICQSYH